MRPQLTRVLAIGLDSAEHRLIDRWCESGDLPNLSALRQRGAYGAIRTPQALADDAVWASFYTATMPGQHGRFHWQSPDGGLWGERCHGTPFWVDLSQAGHRVAVIDVPKCPLTPGIRGVHVADWLVHGRDHDETCSWPPELAAALLERFGADETDRYHADFLCSLHALPEDKIAVFTNRLLKGLRNKSRYTSELLAEGGWDLFLVAFKEAHCAGHQCWPWADQPENPVLQIYRALDEAVGELIRQAGPETFVVVFSDLGMAPNITGEHFLDAVLRRMEPKLATGRHRLAQRVRRLFHLIPGGSQSDPRRDRLVFQVEHNEISGAVRINLQGRERDGIVRPGEEYELLCDRLTRELSALRDPPTQRPIVARVLRTSAAFPGEQNALLPDLLIEWNRTAPISGAESPLIGRLDVPDPQFRPGNHIADGFFMAAGDGLGSVGEAPAASIVDLAPTLARLLGHTLTGRAGSPIAALCGTAQTTQGS